MPGHDIVVRPSPTLRRDLAFELLGFRAGGSAAKGFDAREVTARLGEIALRDIERTGVNQRADVIGIGGERPVVPVARFARVAEPGVSKAD